MHKKPKCLTRPFDEALELILPRLTHTPSSPDRRIAILPLEGRNELADALRGRVRPGICLTYDQQEQLFVDMRRYLISPFINSTDDNKTNKFNEIVAIVKSYRNTCADCLNGACVMRDPKYPLPKN